MLNIESCWDQKTRKPCTPYGDTNAMVHNQVLLDYGGGDDCDASNVDACPRYHIWPNGTKVHKTDRSFPYSAYKYYCGPCTACDEMLPGEKCCDPFSNPNVSVVFFEAECVCGYLGICSLFLNTRLLAAANIYDNMRSPDVVYSPGPIHLQARARSSLGSVWLPRQQERRLY